MSLETKYQITSMTETGQVRLKCLNIGITTKNMGCNNFRLVQNYFNKVYEKDENT